VGFGGRAIGDASPKYLNTRTTSLFEKSEVLFGLDRAREAVHKEHRAVLMEGYFDVIGAHRVGVRTAVSLSGTALTEAQVRLLRRFADEILLCFDGDAAGQRAAVAAVGLVTSAGTNCRLLSLPPGKDPDDLARSDPELLRRLVQDAPPAWEVLVDQAMGDVSPRSGGEGQEALRRAMRVVGRIPEASIRALYATGNRRLSDPGGRGTDGHRTAGQPGGQRFECARQGGDCNGGVYPSPGDALASAPVDRGGSRSVQGQARRLSRSR
jgi:DNA primase